MYELIKEEELSPAQMKSIRRREYYNRRVKADFAPPKLDVEIPEIIRKLNGPAGG